MPSPKGLEAQGHQRIAVRSKGHAEDATGVGLESADLLAGDGVPDGQGSILAAADETRSIARPRYRRKGG